VRVTASAPTRPRRPARERGRANPGVADRKPPALDPSAVADVEGLQDEAALLRAAIRRLAADADAGVDVKRLAELRHQIEALCTVLKTQKALDGPGAAALDALLADVLEELGDEIGVPE
jgi:hypothetical protein